MSVDKTVLGAVDYIIILLMLLISAGIGVYFRFTGGRQKTMEEYFLAGKDMPILTVAMSVVATNSSAISVIGYPGEVYKFGIHIAFLSIGVAFGTLVSSYVFLPVYFNIQASGAYEYLERRFGKMARTLASFAFAVQMILEMSVVLYAPALSLSAVTNLSVWISTILIGAVCTFYCTIGGMKAVLWTDVFQALLMFVCIVTIITKTCMDMGGFNQVIKVAEEGGRLLVPSFRMDLTTRYTMWNLVFQGFMLSMSSFTGSQIQVQRLLTLRNAIRSRRTLLISLLISRIFILLCCFAGLALYAIYAHCDPITSPEKPISSADQLLPYYVMTSLKDYPGLPGLCICGIFSASLSTVSSIVNSLTAVTMQDVIQPFCGPSRISQKTAIFSAKLITLFYGILGILLTYVASAFGNLIKASIIVIGMMSAPVLGVFFLGMATTRSNEKGAVIGLLTGIAVSIWISFGAAYHASPPKTLPVLTDGCSLDHSLANSSIFDNTSWATDAIHSTAHTSIAESKLKDSPEKDVFILYKISYLWFSTIGFVTTSIIGYFGSFIINRISGKTSEVPSEFISPFIRWLFDMSKARPMRKDFSSRPIKLQVTQYCEEEIASLNT